jgi:hypothetical protein
MSGVITAGGSNQYVVWVEGNGESRVEAVLVWVLKEGSSTPSPFIWCCDGMRSGIAHARQAHKASRVYVGDRPR